MGQGVSRRPVAFRVDGVRLAGLWIEPERAAPGALPLVFLHEGLGSIAQWTSRGRDVPAEIAAATGCPALVYERQGFGASDPLDRPRADDYLYDEAWRVMPQVLDQAGIGRCIPIGHSDGGSIALMFAARHPERVAALVSEAAHVIVEDITLVGIRAARDQYAPPDSRLRAALARYHGDKTEATFSGWADVWLRPGFAAMDMCPHLAGLTAPLLALQGADDEYGSPRQLELIAAHVGGPVETWLVPDCGHAPHFQAHDAVVPRIVDFVRRAVG
ncbi:MAG TPA: alpha/beta hydrolase [Alphaproteobacteria bacterium]|nr:alpha/beta hydrolase [Alphaproteobacteria bacterium]